jgi:hypothetical protein
MILRTMRKAFSVMNWRDVVDTGSFTFPVGNNSRNVDDGPMRVDPMGELSVQGHGLGAGEL